MKQKNTKIKNVKKIHIRAMEMRSKYRQVTVSGPVAVAVKRLVALVKNSVDV